MEITLVTKTQASCLIYTFSPRNGLAMSLSSNEKDFLIVEGAHEQNYPEEIWGRDADAIVPPQEHIRRCVRREFGLPDELCDLYEPLEFDEGEEEFDGLSTIAEGESSTEDTAGELSTQATQPSTQDTINIESTYNEPFGNDISGTSPCAKQS